MTEGPHKEEHFVRAFVCGLLCLEDAKGGSFRKRVTIYPDQEEHPVHWGHIFRFSSAA